MQRRDVVTCFLQRPDGRVLLLRRSGAVGSYRGKWAGVSGGMERPDPWAEALREVQEETGIPPSDVRIVASVAALDVPDEARGVVWVVHPLLARVPQDAEARLDWEHTEGRWVRPDEVGDLDAVPRLAEALASLLEGAPQ